MCDEGFDSSDWDSGDVGDVSDYDVDDSFDDSDVDVEGGEPADFDYDDVDADVDIADDSVLDTYDVDVETDLDTTDEVDYDLEETADLDEANLSDVDLCADDAGEGEDFSDIADLMDEADSADIPAPLTVDDITDEMLEDYMVAEQEDLDDADDAGDGEDVKVLRRDPDELLEIGMRNVEDILDVRRDDMLDKGMAEDEIEEAIAKEREQLQQEFVQDAFPEEMENIEEPFDIENMEEEPEDLTDEEPVTEQLEEDIADTELADEEDLPEPSEEFDNGMDTAEETNEYDSEENLDAAAEDEVTDVIEHEEMPLDAFEETEDMAEEELDLLAAQLDLQTESTDLDLSDKMEEFGETEEENDSDLGDEEPNGWRRSLADQNLQADRLPASEGEWSNPERVGDSEWKLDDDAEIQWRHGGETHTMTGAEFKERYGVEGVEYKSGEPDFEPFEDELIGSVQLEDLPTQRGGRDGSYAIASQLAAEKLGITADEVTEYMRENGLTWHECGDCKTMRAIPVEVNAAFPHTGGISIQRSVRAVAEGISDAYGEISLNKSEMTGLVDTEELESAKKGNKELYRKYKS